MQLQKLNNHFSEGNAELLLCMACLKPSNLFCAFDKQQFVYFTEFYPSDFSMTDLMAFDIQLQNYIVDMHSNDAFLELNGIGDLARKMIETNKDVIYLLIYLLIKLVLTLFVVIALRYLRGLKGKVCEGASRTRMSQSKMMPAHGFEQMVRITFSTSRDTNCTS